MDDSFEGEFTNLKETYRHGVYEYRAHSNTFSSVTTNYFKKFSGIKLYGVYIVRQQDTKEVIYIGKGGTINSKGKFKGQDVPHRLKNVKGDTSANKWFNDLLEERGTLVIEYVLLPINTSPALVEAILLQKFLNEFHRLPYKNKAL